MFFSFCFVLSIEVSRTENLMGTFNGTSLGFDWFIYLYASILPSILYLYPLITKTQFYCWNVICWVHVSQVKYRKTYYKVLYSLKDFGGDQETKPGCCVTTSSAAGQWLSPRPETVLPQTIVATTCLQHLELQELDITVFHTVSPEEQNISQHIAISLSDAFHHSKCNFLPEHRVSSCMKGLNIFSSSILLSLSLLFFFL